MEHGIGRKRALEVCRWCFRARVGGVGGVGAKK